MSCRIIGRKFDQAFFRFAIRTARERWNISEVRATYIPTAKNGLVKTLYDDFGLEKTVGVGEFRYRARATELDLVLPEEIALVEKL